MVEHGEVIIFKSNNTELMNSQIFLYSLKNLSFPLIFPDSVQFSFTFQITITKIQEYKMQKIDT